ncbi:MAG: hypothetical protein C4519_24330 [Desulfobacteraceae bacterium]|nr:MAG: hypothetical protein C4519_24330 [Desulfobacteraceae bacterium]
MIPNSLKKKLFDGDIDLSADTIKVMLLDSNHVDDQDAQEFIDDVSANEVSGDGYTAGGATLANKAVTQDNTDNEGVFDADDVTWADSTITARYAVVYKDTGTPSTSPIIQIIDFGEDKVSSAGPFTITWNAEGILNLN